MGRFVNPIPQICLPPIIAKAVILKKMFSGLEIGNL